jgi:hypothetical protein
MKLWKRLFKSLNMIKSAVDTAEIVEIPKLYIRDYFDKKYKIIIDRELDSYYVEILDWLNKNSNFSVDVKIYIAEKYNGEWIYSSSTTGKTTMFIAFENEDDALFFKIRYETM